MSREAVLQTIASKNAVLTVDVLGREVARMKHQQLLLDKENDWVSEDFETFFSEDDEINSPCSALSVLVGSDALNGTTTDVFGFRLTFLGSNQDRADGQVWQEAFEILDVSDPDRHTVLAVLRIEGWYSSYEGIEWDQSNSRFVNVYETRVKKFYTPEERAVASDNFMTSVI